jgi:hypothetical protein
MKKSKKNLTRDLSFSIDMNQLNLNRRKFDTDEIGRGIGIQKNKKGKGSYTRKNVRSNDDSCGYFAAKNSRNLCQFRYQSFLNH